MKTRTKTPYILATIGLFLSALILTQAPPAAATPDDETVAWFDEPDPLCGSPLHLDDDLVCSNGPFVQRGSFFCPNGISTERLLGERHLFTYNESLVYSQTFENAATWSRFCVETEPEPAPTATPVPNPQARQCPEGFKDAGTNAGQLLCERIIITTSSTPSAAIPQFTG